MSDLVVKFIIRAINEATAPIRAVTNNFEALKAAKKAAEQPFKVARDLSQASEAVSRFAAGARSVVDGPIRIAEDFEAQMSVIQAVTRAGTQDFAAMRAEAARIGAETVLSASQAAQGMAGLARAGFKPREVIAAMPGLVNVSIAGMLDLATATDVVAGSLNAFGLREGDILANTKRLGDVFTAVAQNSSATIGMQGETMKNVASLAHRYGMSLEQVAAWTKVLADVNVRGAEAGTGMKEVILRLATQHSPLARASLRYLGVATKDAHGNLRDFTSILAELGPALAKLPTKKQADLMTHIFGAEAQNAAGALIAAASSGKVQEFAAQLRKVSGAADEAAKVMSTNAKGASDELSSAIEGLSITIGDSGLPTIRDLRLLVANLINDLDAWAQKHPTLVKWTLLTIGGVAILASVLTGIIVTIAATASALGVLAVAMGSTTTGTQLLGLALRWVIGGGLKRLAITIYAQAIPALYRFAAGLVARAVPAMLTFLTQLVAMAIGVEASAVPALGAVITQLWAMSAAFLATPIGWLVVGIAALVAAAVLLYRNWDSVGPFFTSLWDSITSAFDAAVKWIEETWAGLSTPMKIALAVMMGPISVLIGAVMLIREHWATLGDFFTGLWDGIKRAFTAAIDWLWPKIERLLAAAKSLGSGVADLFTGGDAAPSSTAPTLGPARDLVAGRTPEGAIHLKIDSDQPVSVRRVQASGLELDVDTGLAMVGR